MKSLLFGLGTFALLSHSAFAQPKIAPPRIAPQPTACITSQFNVSGGQWWKSIDLKLTNNCGKAVDFQNSTVTFETTKALNTSFWGNFNPLPYPDGNLNISSQAQTGGNFIAHLHLHFPTYQGANTKLPAGRTITIKYGASTADQINNSVKVYLGEVVSSGNIELTNASSKPSDVSQAYALVHVTLNGQTVSDVQLPWSGMQTLSNLQAGTYAISADSITGANNTYQGSASPASLNVVVGQTAKSTITYTAVEQIGKIAVKLQELPVEIIGYPTKPTVTLTQAGSSSSTPVTVDWNTTATVSQLKNGSTYTFATPTINFNNNVCQPTFTPGSLAASDAEEVPTTNLTYACSQIPHNTVTLNVTGAPATLTSLVITLTPNNNTNPVTKTISLNNGTGTDTVSLPNGVIYNVSSEPVTGYNTIR